MVDDPIWQALAQMRIEPPGAALSFTRRLARENGWSRAHAEAVCHEYRRFLYLAATGAAEVTPSDQVDQAWHLHLAYTRHYWEELCARIIGRPLHHGPTAGGASEGRKYRALYAETLRLYRETFGEEPPSNISPPSDIRFGTRYQWVDRTRHYLLPRKAVSIAGMAGGAALLAACTALAASKVSEVTRSSGTSRIFDAIVGLVILLAIAFVLASLLRWSWRLARRLMVPRASANRRKRTDDSTGDSSISSFDGWSSGGGAAAAGGAAFAAGGGDFGGGGAEASWDGDSGNDSGGDSGCSSDSGCSGCGGGCGGD